VQGWNDSLMNFSTLLFIISLVFIERFFGREVLNDNVSFLSVLMRGEDNAAWLNQASGLIIGKGLLIDASVSEFYNYGLGGILLGYVFYLNSALFFDINMFDGVLEIVKFSMLFYILYSIYLLILLQSFIVSKKFLKKYESLAYPFFIVLNSFAVVLLCLIPLLWNVGFLSLIAALFFVVFASIVMVLFFDAPNDGKSNGGINFLLYPIFFIICYLLSQSWPFILPPLMMAIILFLNFNKNLISIILLILLAISGFLGGYEQIFSAISDRGGLVRLARTGGGTFYQNYFELYMSISAMIALIIFSLRRYMSQYCLILAYLLLSIYIYWLVLKILSPYSYYSQSKILLSGIYIGLILYTVSIISNFKIFSLSLIGMITLIIHSNYQPFISSRNFINEFSKLGLNELALDIQFVSSANTNNSRFICTHDFSRHPYYNYSCARWVAAFSPLKSEYDRSYRNLLIRASIDNWDDLKSHNNWVDEYLSGAIDFNKIAENRRH
jgi:hypothetical protein